MSKKLISSLIIVIILGASILGIVLANRKIATHAEVYIEGNVLYTLDLSDDQEIKIGEDANYNIIVIKNGKIYVSEADCMGHDCERMGKKNKVDDTIICSPHRLVIKLIRK